MSLSVKTQGGSGGFFPSIFVTGLSETDTVYATMGSKTVSGKWETRTVDETEVSGFLISPLREIGMWTVTATNGVKTRTVDVLADVATEFEIYIDLYKLYLYRAGDDCEEVTGGWEGRAWYWDTSSAQGVAPTLTFNSDYLSIAFVNERGGACQTVKDVDVTNYSKLCAITSGASGSTDMQAQQFGTAVRSENRWGYAREKVKNLTAGNNALTEVDVSSVSGSFDIAFFNERAAVTIKVHEVWLEE